MKQALPSLLFFFACMGFANGQIVYEDFNQNRIADYFFTSGSFIEYEANPATSTANNSPTVARYVRNPAETFDVIVMDMGNMQDLTDYINGTKQISIDVYSPAPGITVQVTLEDTNTAEPGNFPVGRHSIYLGTTTQTNAWENMTLTFDQQPDASVANTAVERFVLLFNPGTMTDDTYYFDNVNGPELQNDPCAGAATDQFIFQDMECQQNVDITFKHGAKSRVRNPDASGDNTSDWVYKYDRNSGELDDVVVGDFAGGALDLSINNEIQLQIYDSDAPSVVTVAFQDAGGNDILVAQDSTGNSNIWETLRYDLSSISGSTNVTNFVILYKPGTNSFATAHFDNFKAVEPAPISVAESGAWSNTLKLWPNPTTGQANIEFTLNQAEVLTFQVLDITGKTVMQWTETVATAGEQQVQFTTESLPAGVYLMSVQGESTVQSLRFYHLGQ